MLECMSSPAATAPTAVRGIASSLTGQGRRLNASSQMRYSSSPRNGPPIMKPNRTWLLIEGVIVRIRKTTIRPRMTKAGQSRGSLGETGRGSRSPAGSGEWVGFSGAELLDMADPQEQAAEGRKQINQNF